MELVADEMWGRLLNVRTAEIAGGRTEIGHASFWTSSLLSMLGSAFGEMR